MSLGNWLVKCGLGEFVPVEREHTVSFTRPRITHESGVRCGWRLRPDIEAWCKEYRIWHSRPMPDFFIARDCYGPLRMFVWNTSKAVLFRLQWRGEN